MPQNFTSSNNLLGLHSDSESSRNTTSMGMSSDFAQQTGVRFECNAERTDDGLITDIRKFEKLEKPEVKLVWRNIILFGYVHLAALYGGWLFFKAAQWYTVFFAILIYSVGIIGITAGAHRLWAHRSYKAKWPLRLILIIFNTIAFQDAVFHWARDHRVHHKFSETNADPHNPSRGFFFSHIGWLLCKKHPDVVAKGRSVDLSDLLSDPIVMFQKKYYMILMPLACFILPTFIPVFLWNESLINAWLVPTMFRWCFSLNVTWSINSVAHKFGGHPYDATINPSESPVISAFAFGDGWHNYHHVFPWDYKGGEWGNFSKNLTLAFIDFFAKIGWAYDLKSVAPETIRKRVKRTGDGSHALKGWDDKDLSSEERKGSQIINKKLR